MIDLSPDDIAFLRQARVAHLATASAAGEPHVIPMCFAFDGTHLFTAIDAKPKRVPLGHLRRVRNLRENPRVSLVVDSYEEDWGRLRYVLIAGRGEILEEGDERERGLELLREKYSQYRAMPDLGRGPVIRIAPERVVAWHSTPSPGPA